MRISERLFYVNCHTNREIIWSFKIYPQSFKFLCIPKDLSNTSNKISIGLKLACNQPLIFGQITKLSLNSIVLPIDIIMIISSLQSFHYKAYQRSLFIPSIILILRGKKLTP